MRINDLYIAWRDWLPSSICVIERGQEIIYVGKYNSACRDIFEQKVLCFTMENGVVKVRVFAK